MKPSPPHIALPFFLALVSTPLLGQAVPAATNATQNPGEYEGFSLPDTGGTLRYTLTVSESVVSDYNGTPGTGANAYTNVGGDVAYLSRSQSHPFSAIYSGGYLIGTSDFASYSYQNLALSQVFRSRNWNTVITDNVSYLPETPASGLSGIPGDLSTDPVQVGSSVAGLGILTTYAQRVANTVAGTTTRKLTGKTSLSVTGEYDIQRYIDAGPNGGIDNDEEMGTLTLNHRFDERTSAGASYSFTNSTFDYGPLSGLGTNGYQTHTFEGIYYRQLTKKLTLNLQAGPQLLTSSGGLITGNSVNFAANASLNYLAKSYRLGISYVRSINNGGGVVIGARTDYATASVNRTFHRRYQVTGLVGYNHSESLTNSALGTYDSSGVLAGGEFSTVFHRDFSVFASYTLERQNFQGTAAGGNAFQGLSNYITVGLTYSPPALFTKR